MSNIFSNFANKFFSSKSSPFWYSQKDTTRYLKMNSKDDILKAYNSCSTLKSIIDHSSEVFSRGIFYVEKNGKVVENHYIVNFFNSSSILQNDTFQKEYAKQILLYGICVIVKQSNIITDRKGIKNAFILEFDQTEIFVKEQYKTNKDAKDIKNINEVIEKVEYTNQKGKKDIYNVSEDILIISNQPLFIENKKLTCNHRLIAAEQIINVLISAYELRIYYNRKRGGTFLISKKPLNAGVNERIFNQESEEEALKKALNAQTISEDGAASNTVFTNQSYDTKALSLPLTSLELNKGIIQAKADLCDLLNFPLPLLNNIEGTTFDNKASADKQLYTSLIIPMWQNFDNKVNNTLIIDKSEVFKTDFSHIESLQKDKKTDLEAKNIETNMIILLNDKIKNGIITTEIAVNILVEDYNYSEEMAKKRLIKTPKIIENAV